MAEELDKVSILVDQLDAINQVDQNSTSSKYIVDDETVDKKSASTDQPLHLKNISKTLDLILTLIQERDQSNQSTGKDTSEDQQQTVTSNTSATANQSTNKLSSILTDVERQRYRAVFEILGKTLGIGKFTEGPEANRLLTPSIDNREDVKQILPPINTKSTTDKLKDNLLATLIGLALAYNVFTENISGTLQSFYRFLKNTLLNIGQKVKNLFNGLSSLKTTITENLNKFKTGVSSAFGSLKRLLGNSTDDIVKVVLGIGAALSPKLAKLAPNLLKILKSLKNKLGTFVDNILKFLKNLIPSWLKNLLPTKPPSVTTPGPAKPAPSKPGSVKPPAASGVLKPSATPSVTTPGPAKPAPSKPGSVKPPATSGVLKPSATPSAIPSATTPGPVTSPATSGVLKPSAAPSVAAPGPITPTVKTPTVGSALKPGAITPSISTPWYLKIPGANKVASVAASAKKLALDPIINVLSSLFAKMGGARGMLTKIGRAMNNPIVRKIPIVAPLLEVFFGKGDIEELKNKRASNEITTDEELYRLAGQRVIKGVGGLIGGASGALLLSGLPGLGTLAGGLIGDILGRIGADAVTNYLLPKEATMDIGRLVVDSPLKGEELQDFLVKGDRVYKFNNKDEVLGMKEGGAVNSLISSITNTNERQFSISSRQVKILEEIRDGIRSLGNKDNSKTSNNYGGNRDNNSRPAPSLFTLRSEFDSMNNIATI